MSKSIYLVNDQIPRVLRVEVIFNSRHVIGSFTLASDRSPWPAEHRQLEIRISDGSDTVTVT